MSAAAGTFAADADRRRRQLRGAKALVAMLEQGQREGLPVLHWSVNVLGDVVGDVHGLTCTADQQRAAFDLWCALLGAQRWNERTDSDGVTHLHAVFAWRSDNRVTGAIRAVIVPDGMF